MKTHRSFFLLLPLLLFVLPQVRAQELAEARPAFREIVLTGFTRARASLPLVAETAGRVLEITADIGEAIADEGVFARLDAIFIELDLESNRVSQEQLRSRIDFDRKEVKRYRELAGRGNTAQSTLDELEQMLRNNTLQLQSLAVQERVLTEKLTRTRIQASPGWRVTSRRIELGQQVNAGEVVGEVADFSRLLVPLALTPEQLAVLGRDQTTLTLYLPDRNLEVPAHLYRSNPGFDPDTRKIAVEFALQDVLPEQRGGLRAQLRLALPERTGAVLLPAAAVEESYDEYWVTRENGERLRVVHLGNGSEKGWIRVAAPQIEAGQLFQVREVAHSEGNKRP